jgi:hypothetical protein
MSRKLFMSFLRHLITAVLTAAGVVLSTPANISWTVFEITLAGTVIPVIIKYVDPTETDYGVNTHK